MRSRSSIAGLTLLIVGACTQASEERVGRASGALDIGGWEPVSAALGSPPNFAQLGNGSTMSVVSAPSDTDLLGRRGAKAGALVELYYPHYAADNLWDSYVGVRALGTKVRWAHDLTLKEQKVIPDTGLVVTSLAGTLESADSNTTAANIELLIEDVLRPANDAHVRHVTVKNTGTQPLTNVDVAFYAFYTIGTYPTGDTIHFDSTSGAFLQVDGNVAIATLGDRKPIQSHCGEVLNFLGGSGYDARLAVENDALVDCDSRGPTLQGVNGALIHRLSDVAAGQSADITYAIGLGKDEASALFEAQNALSGGFAPRVDEDKAKWSSVLAKAKMPYCLPNDAKDVYRRAIVTMLQHRVDNGAFIAAPTLTSPGYRFIWPRDGSKTAVDLIEAGFLDEAAGFFELLEKLLLPDGSFAVNYMPDASGPFFDFGASGNENDQPGMLPWGVDKVYAAKKDKAWLAARWNGVKAASDHLVSIMDAEGLVAPSRDLWELETGKTWTYSNGAALAGLEAATRIATELGFLAEESKYKDAAAKIRTAITTKMVTKDGYYARGEGSDGLDERVEIGNLALGSGGFGLLPDSDPALMKLGDLVQARLADPNGGVRRYEGDQYYGGQQWPVAAVWLAFHHSARGDRASAEKAFNEMTRQAHTTQSAMLGEQFKVANDAWIGAIPLVWSEAAYTRLAWSLYGCPEPQSAPPAVGSDPAGGGDAGAGAGSDSPSAHPKDSADDGCGCRTAGTSTTSSTGAWAALAVAVAIARRRRRRA